MKTLIFLVFFSQTCLAQYKALNNNKFYVSGDAIIRIAPNQVIMDLGVMSRGKDLVKTKVDNSLKIKNAIEYCVSHGILRKYIQTDFVNINPHYSYDKDIEIDYYSVYQGVSIVIEDISKYEKMLTDLLVIGINKINNIRFRTTELKKYRFKVRKMAIEAAKEKAEFLTKEVGMELGKILNVSERIDNIRKSFNVNNYSNVITNSIQNTGYNEESGSLVLGMISIKATVTLTYEILTN